MAQSIYSEEHEMKFESKEEFAKAIIDAGENGLVYCNRHVFFNGTYTNPFRGKGDNTPMVDIDWDSYEGDWQPYVKPIPDKALVWCWNDYNVTKRILKVYDAKNKTTFYGTSERNGPTHTHIKQLTPEEIQPWMQELVNACEE